MVDLKDTEIKNGKKRQENKRNCPSQTFDVITEVSRKRKLKMARNYKRSKIRKCPKLEDMGLQIKRALLRAESKFNVMKMGHRQRVGSSVAQACNRNLVTQKKITISSQNTGELFSI